MSQSLSKIYVHAIFHVKNEAMLIQPDNEIELYAYMGGLLKTLKSTAIIIGGVSDHIHVLSIMSKNISLADFMEFIKKNSSRWLKTKGDCYQNFAWQGGYAGYSISQSKLGIVKRYIENQKEHHKHQTFREEYYQFLKEYIVDYNEDYLWT